MVTRRLMLGVALLAMAASAAAQEPVRPRTRERTFTFSLGPDDALRMASRRGALGVLVDLTADAARDSIGARIAGVTPGGAAEHAGVQTGDLVVRFNGTRLASAAVGREDEGEDQSRPGLRLIRLASRLDPGDTVRLELRRDSRSLTVTFAAEESELGGLMTRMGNLRDLMPNLPGGPEGMMRVFVNGGAGVSDLELVKVNPQLAEGLGIPEGLLVVDVGSDTALGLRAGDVITGIGGRRPASPAQAMRILSTYDSNEAVAFDVTRHGRRQSVSGRIPAGHGWRAEPNSFQMRLPPMPDLWMKAPRFRLDGPKTIRIVHQT